MAPPAKVADGGAEASDAAHSDDKPSAPSKPDQPNKPGTSMQPPAADAGDAEQDPFKPKAHPQLWNDPQDGRTLRTNQCPQPANGKVSTYFDTTPLPPPTQGSYALLDFDVVEMGYASQLDRLVTISKAPSTLRVLKSSGEVERSVALSAEPVALSVSPDGKRTAVATAASVVLVDLATGNLQTFAVAATIADVIDAGGAWLYLIATGNALNSPRTVHNLEIATGAVSALNIDQYLAQDAELSLNAGAGVLFAARDNLLDISHGPASIVLSGINKGNWCSPLFSSSAGSELYDACGRVFRLNSADLGSGLTYKTEAQPPHHAAYNPQHKLFAAVFGQSSERNSIGGEVRVFDDVYFSQIAAATLPSYEENGQSVALQGEWLSYAANGESLYVLARRTQNRAAIVTLPTALAAATPPTLDDTGPYKLLGASVFDAQRSRELDRIVLVTTAPSQLVVLDPNTQTQTSLPLPSTPKQLALSPSGRSATLAYNGWLAYYQLDPLRWERDIDLKRATGPVSVDDKGYAYTSGLSVELTTGQTQTTKPIDGIGYYVPEQHAFYVPHLGGGQSAYDRVLVQSGLIDAIEPSASSEDEFLPCFKWWIRDGQGMAACGTAFTIGDGELHYRGLLADPNAGYSTSFIFQTDRSPESGLLALVEPDRSPSSYRASPTVMLHDDRSLELVGAAHLPAFAIAGEPVTAVAGYAFFSKDGKRLDVLAQSDPSRHVQQDYGLLSTDLTKFTPCPTGPDLPRVDGAQVGDVKLEPVDFDVIDAAISRKAGRIAIASSDPPRVRVLDAANGDMMGEVELLDKPTSLVLAQDGRSVYVSHDGWVSQVSLDPLEVSAVYPVRAGGIGLALSDDELFIVSASTSNSSRLRILDLKTGADSQGATIKPEFVRRSPDGLSLLHVAAAGQTGLLKTTLETARSGKGASARMATYVGERFFFSSDGTRLFAANGGILDLQHTEKFMDPMAPLGLAEPEDRYVKLGQLPDTQLCALDASSQRKQLAIGPCNNKIQILDEESYNNLQDIDLPRLQLGGDSFSAKVQFVFFSSDAGSVIALAKIESTKPIRNPFAIVRAPVTAARP